MNALKQQLPIVSILPELQAALASGSAVLAAPPGTGKTTVVPLALLHEQWLAGRSILVLEPRRLAARAAAARMSWLLSEPCGQTVGYQIRFDRCMTEKTRIEVLTEGILTRRIQNDPDLKKVGLIIFDEFHERSLHADLALALCLDVCQLTDLRLLVMSATLDTGPIAELLGGAPVIECKGQSHPVVIEYLSREPTGIIEPAVRGIERVLSEQQGDILAFLPGAGEIKAVQRELAMSLPAGAICLPLYGNLSQQEQDRAIVPDPEGRRRVLLATSIAETSLTIEGVCNVVDSGWSRRNRFNPTSGLSGLETVRVSQASATQRAGRAGRLGPGYCLRLWSHTVQHGLAAFLPPEIIGADLANLVLELALWGVADPSELRWLDPPRTGAYGQARELLHLLGALQNRKLTDLGRKLAVLPLHPRLGLMLLMAVQCGQAGLACDLAALLSERDILPQGRQQTADLQVRLQILESWRQGRGARERSGTDPALCSRIDRLASQWLTLLAAKRAPSDHSRIAGLLAYAYPDRIARRRGNAFDRYQLAQGKGARLPPADPLAASEYLVVPHLDAGRAEGKIYLAAAAELSELRHGHQQLFTETAQVQWDESQARVLAVRIERAGEIITRERVWQDVDSGLIVQAMLEGIRQRGMDCLPWSPETRQLQARIACLRLWQPEEGWPDFSDAALLADLNWLAPYLDGISKLSQLKKINLASVLTSMLNWEQQQNLQIFAPARLQVPSGSRILLEYSANEPPCLAVRIQEMFGASETPAICRGKVPVLIHLLSPARRPLQITADLAGFWSGSYQEVRKEMKGRYPKHFWPEDPAKAAATTRVRSR